MKRNTKWMLTSPAFPARTKYMTEFTDDKQTKPSKNPKQEEWMRKNIPFILNIFKYIYFE